MMLGESKKKKSEMLFPGGSSAESNSDKEAEYEDSLFSLESLLREAPGPEEREIKSLLAKFERYMLGILEAGKHINLTTINEPREFIEKHYIDSLVIIGEPEFESAERIIDIGTGGGFPGIPLAICCPGKKFVLADSLNKRLKVVDSLAHEIGLSNVEVLHGRAEDIGRDKNFRENFDLCVCRAVASLPVLCEYGLPLLRKGGYLAAYKTAGAVEEIEDSANAREVLGGGEVRVSLKNEKLSEVPKEDGDALSAFADSEHCIFFIEKIRETPGKYPRRAGVPGKKPL